VPPPFNIPRPALVEYDHLIKHLYQLSINGKTWWLIKICYSNSYSSVHSNSLLSDSFQVHRGVKQDSVLSPILSNIAMDELLKDLSSEASNLVIRGLHVSSAAHADNVRTCNIGIESIQSQSHAINCFTSRNSLRLDSSKTEIVHMSSHSLPPEEIHLQNSAPTVKKGSKMPGSLVDSQPIFKYLCC